MCCNTAPNHGQGWYEVIGTDTSIDFINPEGFEKWCKPMCLLETGSDVAGKFAHNDFDYLQMVDFAGECLYVTAGRSGAILAWRISGEPLSARLKIDAHHASAFYF